MTDPAAVPAPVVPAENADELYEHAPCGYLSMLPDGTIIKVNATFLSLTGHRREELVGRRRFADLLAVGDRIYSETHLAPLLSMQGSVREIALNIIRSDGSHLPVLLNGIFVRTPEGAPYVVRLSVFDATDRREYERELLRARERAERSEERARVLAQTLQSSFIPPAPPDIPGIEVAAAYRPAGLGDEVGGDFYDVFRISDTDWAVVIGDVCGKGAEAATVTALARYTVRAAAMSKSHPSGVLATLNDALLRHPTDRFCTVVFMRIRRDPDGDLHVTISSGGHALPLRVEDGAVEAVGRPGTALGIVEDPALEDTSIVLTAGAFLFAYTDGVTEGRRGDEFFGEKRLAEALVDLHDSALRRIPQAIIDQVIEFQAGFPRDDIAAVLLGVPPSTHGLSDRTPVVPPQ